MAEKNKPALDAVTIDPKKIIGIIEAAKLLAREYRSFTGKPLGITGEVGEFEAANLLDLDLAPARTPGYDAVDEAGKRYQIKTRRLADYPKPGQRIGAIKLEQAWDAALLVLLNENFDPVEIHEAERPEVEGALTAPGSKARNHRGQLSVSKFKSIGRCVGVTGSTVGQPEQNAMASAGSPNATYVRVPARGGTYDRGR